MEALIDSQHGVSVLLASVVVVLALHLFLRVGEFIVKLMTKKSEGSDQQISRLDLALTQNTQVVRELRIQIELLERELSEVHKLRADIQKLFSAVKNMAGKRWPEIRKAMEEDGIPK